MEPNVTSNSTVASNVTSEDPFPFGNASTFDTLEYLAAVYGPQRHPPEKLIPLTVVYIGTRKRE